MILSNVEILKAMGRGEIIIDPSPIDRNPAKPPFNTSSIDLRLGSQILIPQERPVILNPSQGGISRYLAANHETITLTKQQPYVLEPNKFLLGKTREKIKFPIHDEGSYYAARVEGKSSLARCGILIHFTAPTIHSGFEGTITLEIINLGVDSFVLNLDMYICQMIVEEVKGRPIKVPSQFSGQNTPAGLLENIYEIS